MVNAGIPAGKSLLGRTKPGSLVPPPPKRGNRTNLAEAGQRGASTNRTKADARAIGLIPAIANLKAAGITSVRGLAKALAAGAYPTARGGRWHAKEVQRLLGRIERLSPIAEGFRHRRRGHQRSPAPDGNDGRIEFRAEESTGAL